MQIEIHTDAGELEEGAEGMGPVLPRSRQWSLFFKII